MCFMGGAQQISVVVRSVCQERRERNENVRAHQIIGGPVIAPLSRDIFVFRRGLGDAFFLIVFHV